MIEVEIIKRILLGASGGVMVGLIGYAKSVNKGKKGKVRESFDYKKLGVSVLISAGVGAYSGFTGLPMSDVMNQMFAYVQENGSLVESMFYFLGIGSVGETVLTSFKALKRNMPSLKK